MQFKDLKQTRIFTDMVVTYIAIHLYIGYVHYEEPFSSSLLCFKICSLSINISTVGHSTKLTPVQLLLSMKVSETID